MRLQPVDLLANVGLGGQERGLLVEPLLVERRRPASSSKRTCSARRSRIAAGSRDGSASARQVSSSMVSRWPRSSAPSAVALGARAPLPARPAPRRASTGSRRRSASGCPRPRRVSGSSSTPRKASRPSALAASAPNCSSSRLASPARSLRNASLTTGWICSAGPGNRERRPGYCRARSASGSPGAPGPRAARSPAAASAASRGLAVDRLDLPCDRQPRPIGGGARKAGHALQGHRPAPPRSVAAAYCAAGSSGAAGAGAAGSLPVASAPAFAASSACFFSKAR